MIHTGDLGKILCEVIIYFTCFFICCSLTRRRFSKSVSLAVAVGMPMAVVLGQIFFFYSCRDIMLVLTLLPFTAYLPGILCLHVMSASGFVQTATVWTTGLISRCILKILRKLLGRFLLMREDLAFDIADACLLLGAVLLLLLVVCFLSKPFRTYVQASRTDWLFLCFPVSMVVLLFSYIGTTAKSTMLLLLLFLTVLSVFLMLVRALVAFDAVERTRESEQKITASLQAQRREYEDMNARMEAGRIYRHDMRHHLMVLENLAKEDDSARIMEYVGSLRGQLSDTERQVYCENVTVNAVLSAYIQEAKKDCEVETDIFIPEKLRYDAMDVCAVLANALENARNECKKISEPGERHIRVKAQLKEEWKLFLCVENSCGRDVLFGKDGLPEAPLREGHGIGLKSIDAVVKKYDGMLQCECSDGVFRLNAVLFRPKEEEQAIREGDAADTAGSRKARPKKAMPAVTGILLVILFLCGIPLLAGITQRKMAAEPTENVLGRTIQWGNLTFCVDALDIPKNDAVRNEAEDIIREMEDIFLEYAKRSYLGNVGMDIMHTVLRDDECYFSIRFNATVNAGGSGEYSRCLTLDKRSGELLELAGVAGEDYIEKISAEVFRQMQERVEAGEGNYFIPGGIWREDECFKEISPDQNFYINERNELVIVFDSYQVAPGNMGMPEFVIPGEVLGKE